MKFLKRIDNISTKTTLYGNNNSDRLQTHFGGILTIISYSSVIAAIFYFFIRFLHYDKPFIVMNEEKERFIEFPLYNKMPFMMRVSDEKGGVIPNQDKLFSFLYLWITADYDEKGNLVQTYNPIPMIQCNQTHIKGYENAFEANKISDFFCPNFEKDVSLDGYYGSDSPYSFSISLIYQCVNSTQNTCYPQDEIDNKLTNIYMDYIVGDNIPSSYTSNPINKMVFSSRLSITNSNFIRVWLGFHHIDYISDFGLIFEEKNNIFFHSIEFYKQDLSLYSKSTFETGQMPFAAISIQNHTYKTTYNRSYMKFQDLLANLGGILKAIILITEIIYFIFGTRLSELLLMNRVSHLIRFNLFDDSTEFNLFNSSLNMPSKKVGSNEESNMQTIFKKMNDITTSDNNYKTSNLSPSLMKNNFVNKKAIGEDNNKSSIRIPYNLSLNKIRESAIKMRKNFEIDFIYKIFPFKLSCGFCMNNKDYKVFNLALQKLNETVTPETIITSKIELDHLKMIILSCEELALFNFLYSKTGDTLIIGNKTNDLKIMDILNNYLSIKIEARSVREAKFVEQFTKMSTIK